MKYFKGNGGEVNNRIKNLMKNEIKNVHNVPLFSKFQNSIKSRYNGVHHSLHCCLHYCKIQQASEVYPP